MKRVNIQWSNDQIALIWLFFTDSKIGQNNKSQGPELRFFKGIDFLEKISDTHILDPAA